MHRHSRAPEGMRVAPARLEQAAVEVPRARIPAFAGMTTGAKKHLSSRIKMIIFKAGLWKP